MCQSNHKEVEIHLHHITDNQDVKEDTFKGFTINKNVARNGDIFNKQMAAIMTKHLGSKYKRALSAAVGFAMLSV